MNRLIQTLLLVFACATATAALAQQYPTKPIKLIVGIAPGGGMDFGARLIASKFSEVLGQPVVVVNQSGAGGTIAAGAAAAAAPDGYTLVYTSTALLIAPSLYKELTFDPVKSFTVVGGSVFQPLVVAVNPAVPAKSAAELIALLKANPGKYSYGSPGVGSVHHLAMELFKKQAGVDIVHIPYKGAGLYLSDLISGALPIAILSAAAAIPHAKAGKIRPIALTTRAKLSIVPDWPALADTLPGFDVAPSQFILAPAGTPAAVIARLSEALKTVLSADDIIQSFMVQATIVEFVTPQALAASIKTGVHKWGVLAKESGATP